MILGPRTQISPSWPIHRPDAYIWPFDSPLLYCLAIREVQRACSGADRPADGILFCGDNVVSLSYLTYLDPATPRERELVRLVEYVPVYVLLIWSASPAIGGSKGPAADRAR